MLKHTQGKARNLDEAENLIRNSKYFDADWYLSNNVGGLTIKSDPASHYLTYGRRMGFEPSPYFSGKAYLERYPDVAQSGDNPLLHYLRYGQYEGRMIDGEVLPQASDPTIQTAVGPTVREPLALRLGLRNRKQRTHIALIRNSEFFDADWYCGTHFLDRAAPRDPASHYLTKGAKAGFDPGPRFSSHRYLAAYPDVAREGINPLLHYLIHGQAEGRMAYAVPAPSSLREINRPADLAASGTNPSLERTVTGTNDPASAQTEATSRPMIPMLRSINAPNILFVSGEPDTPGNYYRVLHYVAAAEANGWRAEWIRMDQLGDRLSEIGSYDFLVIWRAPLNPVIQEAIAAMHELGRTVIFDCDDLMTEPRFATLKLIDGIRSNSLTEQGVQDHFSLIRDTMMASDLCFTTSDQLAFHMRWSGKTTFVNPNGFSQFTHDLSRDSAKDWKKQRDGLVRIGYAGGSRTHQKDLALAMGAIGRILREHPECRLVLFRMTDGTTLIDVEEYPELDGLHHQIEWRPLQPLINLPVEMARFDINLAPLEVGNPFCEAKSQLKFFEAGLVDCVTVASPTGPFRDYMTHGKTGFLAITGDEWYACLKQLVNDPDLRRELGRNAYLAALANFGPRRRALQFGSVLDQLLGGTAAARAFALSAQLASHPPALPRVFPSTVVFEQDKGGTAEVTVIIPLYNYASVVIEALDSVRDQTLTEIDLVIVDGFSTDNSLEVALDWAQRNANRFNCIKVLKNLANYGLGFCRNSGFDAADSNYVLPLDADNRLRPECAELLLAAIKQSGTAYVYPTIQHFGTSTAQISDTPYSAQRFAAGNYVDAMALISKEAWAMVGGYNHVRHGWEDYDFWVRLAEMGMAGEWCPQVLADYRVHQTSMMKTQTIVDTNYRNLNLEFHRRHPWVALVDTETRRYPRLSEARVTPPEARSRLDDLLPILRCPRTGQKLTYDETREALISHDGMVRWPIAAGRPCLSPDLTEPMVMSPDHISNELPDEALQIVRETKGWVLSLSAGGSRNKFPHVVEMEFAVFRHTDVVGDAHHLPFDDGCFDAVVVENAFEHYHDPSRVAAEIHRVLKPGGRLHVRTAFLQPLHEKPYHFYNCTRHGMERWFEEFDTDLMHVSTNFCPNHTLAWVASEAETALRQDISDHAADRFMAAPIGQLVEIWRNPAQRDTTLWTDFEKLSQDSQEIIAAGFELFARRSADLPQL